MARLDRKTRPNNKPKRKFVGPYWSKIGAICSIVSVKLLLLMIIVEYDKYIEFFSKMFK